MNILIYNYSEFSDLIFSTTLIRNLKTSLDARIFCLIKEEYSDAFGSNPYIDEIYFKESGGLSKLLNIESVDLVIDLNDHLFAKFYCFTKGINYISISHQRINKWLKVNMNIERLSPKHYSDYIIEKISIAGFKADSLGLDFFIPEKDEVEIKWLPKEFQSEFILLSLHTKYNTRQLPINKLIELSDRINKLIIVTGDDADLPIANEIEKFFEKSEQGQHLEEGLTELNKKSIILNLCGKLNRNQIANLVKKSIYVFSHDSWLIPVASAFRKEIYTIWGNTIPLFGKYPYKTKFTVLENNRLPCRPCSVNGFSQCPKRHLKCLNGINFDFYIPE